MTGILRWITHRSSSRKKSSEVRVEIVHHWHSDTLEAMGFRAQALLSSAPAPTTPRGQNALLRLTNAMNKARKDTDNDGRALEQAIILFEKVI